MQKSLEEIEEEICKLSLWEKEIQRTKILFLMDNVSGRES